MNKANKIRFPEILRIVILLLLLSVFIQMSLHVLGKKEIDRILLCFPLECGRSRKNMVTKLVMFFESLSLIFLDGLSYQGKTLLMGFGYCRPFIWSQFVCAKTGYPHVPIPFEMQLHVFHFHFGHLAMLGQQTCRIHRILYEIVGDLQ